MTLKYQHASSHLPCVHLQTRTKQHCECLHLHVSQFLTQDSPPEHAVAHVQKRTHHYQHHHVMHARTLRVVYARACLGWSLVDECAHRCRPMGTCVPSTMHTSVSYSRPFVNALIAPVHPEPYMARVNHLAKQEN